MLQEPAPHRMIDTWHGGSGAAVPCSGIEVRPSPSAELSIGDLRAGRSGIGSFDAGRLGRCASRERKDQDGTVVDLCSRRSSGGRCGSAGGAVCLFSGPQGRAPATPLNQLYGNVCRPMGMQAFNRYTKVGRFRKLPVGGCPAQILRLGSSAWFSCCDRSAIAHWVVVWDRKRDSRSFVG